MSENTITSILRETDAGVLIDLKVVPGARKTKLAGILGDRLKLTISAPPEDGKANRAICKWFANCLNCPVRDVSITSGQTRPQKTLLISGAKRNDVVAILSDQLERQC